MRRARATGIAALLGTVACLLVTQLASAAGQLDPTFGKGGVIMTDFGGDEWAGAVTVQPDGKVVVAGYVETGFLVMRYDRSGSPDHSFGGAGLVRTVVGDQSAARDVAIQADGKIVVVGITFPAQVPGHAFALARYRPNGDLDQTFGAGGIVTTSIGAGGMSQPSTLVIQADGKIVAAGASSQGDLAFARYDANGSLDPSFGVNGLVTIDLGGNDFAQELALQSDGKIVAGGTSYSAAGGMRFVLTRLEGDGSLDLGFGTGGTVTTNVSPVFASYSSGGLLALQDDGRIVAGGTWMAPWSSTPDFVLRRYESDGSVDASFGKGGTTSADFGAADWLTRIVIDGHGRIVAFGSAEAANNADSDFALARFTSSGRPDHTFGVGGQEVTDFGAYDWATDLVLWDVHPIAIGNSTPTPTSVVPSWDLALAKYLG